MNTVKKYIYNEVASHRLSKENAKTMLKELQQQSDDDTHEIAIIGIAGRLPKAEDVEQYWCNLLNGVNCIGEFPEKRRKDTDIFLINMLPKGEQIENMYSKGGFLDEIDCFDPSFFRIPPKEAKMMDPSHRIMLETAWKAIEDSGYGGNRIVGTNTGVFIGKDHTEEATYKKTTDESDPLLLIGAYTGILSSRISYAFNLQGPSLVIDTACSSGLVALHTACQAIKNHDCSMAIAGGLNIMFSPLKNGSLNMAESEDAKVCTFSKNANGSVWSEGVCAVLLKPLRKAIADRDNIYAVIEGSAINNDGASNGITAPNPEAQTDVLIQAWKNARINPEDISYIEAHGTGTILGDPIEIKALTNAFKQFTSKKQFCAIGAVKTNIGHLVAASGLASLLKVVLALKYKKIPLTINFDQPNPYINFCNSPVYLLDRTTTWESNDKPRRAGVSSFGFSGTNCHIVLKEAPVIERPENLSEGASILTISAKSKKALKKIIEKYHDFLEKEPNNTIEEFCYTANTGRGHYPFRIVMLPKNREHLKSMIDSLEVIEPEEFIKLKDIEGIYFGEHQIVPANKKNRDEGELTEEEKKSLSLKLEEKVLQWLQSGRKRGELLEGICMLYAKGADIDWDLVYKDDKLRRISIPGYPLEKGRYWVQPRSAVKKADSEQETKEIECSLLDRCLVQTFEQDIYETILDSKQHWVLYDHKILGNCVLPGTAFIEMAKQATKTYFQGKPLEFTNVAFLNPLFMPEGEKRELHTLVKKEKGFYQFIIVSKTTDAAWVKHCEGRVALSQEKGSVYALEELINECSGEEIQFNLKSSEEAFEFGPRWWNLGKASMCQDKMLLKLTLPKEFSNDIYEYELHPSLLDNAVNVVSQSIGKGMYLPYLYKSLKVFKTIPNTFYSYIRKRENGSGSQETITFNVTLIDLNGDVIADICDYTIKRVDHSEETFKTLYNRNPLLYQLVWNEAGENKNKEAAKGVSVIFNDDSDIGNYLTKVLMDSDGKAIEVGWGDVFRKSSDSHYSINGDEYSYNKLFEELKDKDVAKILYMVTNTHKETNGDFDELELSLNRGAYSLVYMTKALLKNGFNKVIDIVIISKGAFAVTNQEEICPEKAMLSALGKVITREYSNIRCRHIDIDEHIDSQLLLDEIYSSEYHCITVYRNRARYHQKMIKVEYSDSIESSNEISAQDVIIITGGTGGLGLETAKYIALQNQVILALVSRTQIPNREIWDLILEQSDNPKLCNVIRMIREIEAAGSQVICYCADVAKESQIATVIKDIRNKYGKIDGIIHAAGIAGEGFLFKKEYESFKNVLAPKVYGTVNLHKHTAGDNLKFFILYSSILSVTGDAGQGDYAAANAFLDAFAYYRQSKGKPCLSIHWPSWRETGMAFKMNAVDDNGLFKPISTINALRALEIVMRLKISDVMIGELNTEVAQLMDNHGLFICSESIINEKKANTVFTESVKDENNPNNVLIKGKKQFSNTEIQLSKIWGKVLEVTEINVFDSFSSIGGDSILATQLLSEIESVYPGIINISDVFAYPSISELSDYIDKNTLEKGDIKKDTLLSKESSQQDCDFCTLSNIEPFNEIFFKSCFFNSLFPVLKYFNAPILPIITNDIIIYREYFESNTAKNFANEQNIYEAEKRVSQFIPFFDVEYLPYKTLQELLGEYGIEYRTMDYCEDIINRIKKAIDAGMPVILWVDGYYESIRKDLFYRQHLPHTLLFFGYDNITGEFLIVEQLDADSLTYEKRRIKYSEISNAYEGYLKNFHVEMNTPIYYEFYKKEETRYFKRSEFVIQDQLLLMAKYYIKHKELLFRRLEGLKKATQNFSKIVVNEEMLQNNINDLIFMLNNIIRSKYLEDYKNQKLLGPSYKGKSELEQIIQNISITRAYLMKYLISKRYNEKAMVHIVDKLECLYNNEVEYYQLFFKELSQIIQKQKDIND